MTISTGMDFPVQRLTVAIHDPVAETFSFYIMSWLTVPCIAWPSILSDLTEY